MSRCVFTLSLSTLFCVSLSTASTINVGTAGNAANWNLVAGTGAGAAIQAGPLISISSDGTIGTPAISGFNNSTWDGVWTGTLQFTLPAGAARISLLVSNPVADDRWVLRLNGVDIADFARGLAGAGLFNFEAGDAPFAFSGLNTFTINSGFNSGLNTLVLYVNNTGTGEIGSGTRNLGTDATYAGFDGIVSFNFTAVPEPATWCSSLGGILLVGLWRRYAQRLN